jgi:CysZ protein
MPAALALAVAQLGDPRVMRLLFKSILMTLAAFAVIGTLGWFALDAVLAAAGIDDTSEGLRGVIALAGVVIGGWLLWRLVAMAVLQFYADEVVEAVELRHYPAAHAAARPLGWRREVGVGLRAGLRALVANLIALPFALALLVTGVGTAIVFWGVNAVLLGRELTDMAWLRQSHAPGAASPVGSGERFLLGGLVAALLLVPFANFLAPFLGAAMATHLVHRKGVIGHAV